MSLEAQLDKLSLASYTPPFLTLPFELTCRIFASIDSVKDLLNIRRCSRSLKTISESTSIWLSHLKITCDNMRLPLSALIKDSEYPTSYQHLERLACAHLRFRTRVSKHRTKQDCDRKEWVKPLRVRIIPHPGRGRRERFSSMRAFPGGRYIVTSTLTTICLWDLGLRMSDIQRIASINVDIPWDQLNDTKVVIVRTNYAGRKVHIGVSIHSSNDAAHNIYEIDPAVDVPQFTMIGQMHRGCWMRLADSLDGKVSFHFQDDAIPSLGVHHMSTGQTYRWSHEGYDLSFADLYDDDPNLLLGMNPDERQFVVYQLPISERPLKRVDAWGISVIDNPPLQTIVWEEDPSIHPQNVDPAAQGISRWMLSYDSNGSSMCLDFWKRYEGGQLILEHIRLTKSEEGHSFPLRNEIVHASSHQDIVFDPASCPYSKTFPDKTRVMWWGQGGRRAAVPRHLFVHFSSLVNGSLVQGIDKPVDPEFLAVLDLGEDKAHSKVYWSKYSFEPGLGRVCILHRDLGIRVLDYVDW
ncbi:hypothetical protein DL96DRAFT_1579973 [Flagelloscypha sp. PMI_526]|nr:hypothetical protein DL96DRAFT_1579973 [Flagelloscypha sp. PMI_526]